MANAFVSNGTCYMAAGEEADGKMIPCGNSAFGHIQCCQAGDVCLSSNACYNDQYGVTYLSGCSDPDYEADSCPEKEPYEDQPWAGLVYCNGTSNEWAVCEENDKEPTLTEADTCWCPTPTADRNIAFTDGPTLTNIGRLPTALGKEVAWEPGFFPTDKTLTGGDGPTETPTNSGDSGSQTDGGPDSSPTGSPSDGDTGGSSSSDLSKGAKIGVGVGVGLAAVFILAALAFLFMRRRKKHASSEKAQDDLNDPRTGYPGMTPDTPATMAPSELDSSAARPWSMRSELQTPDTPMSFADRAESPAMGEKGMQGNGSTHLRPSDVPAALRPGPPGATGGAAPGNNGPLSPVAELPA